MHRNENCDPLFDVLTAGEAARMWGLTRNAISDACRRGALRSRKSGRVYLITVDDMMSYQRGRYFPDNIPDELKPSIQRWLSRHVL